MARFFMGSISQHSSSNTIDYITSFTNDVSTHGVSVEEGDYLHIIALSITNNENEPFRISAYADSAANYITVNHYLPPKSTSMLLTRDTKIVMGPVTSNGLNDSITIYKTNAVSGRSFSSQDMTYNVTYMLEKP